MNRAYERERDVFKRDKYRKDNLGKPLKVHVGREVVRTAQYEDQTHPPTSNFEGVNAAGWIFFCGSCNRRFVAVPAKEE